MGTRCLKKKREKTKNMINKEDFLNPKNISKLFSGTPQYVWPQGELLGWSGARDLPGAAQSIPSDPSMLIPLGINMSQYGMIGRHVCARGEHCARAKKSRAPPVDFEPQNIPEALVAAFGTAEFRRRTWKSSWDLKKLKMIKSHKMIRSLHTFIKVAIRGPFRPIHSAKFVFDVHFPSSF